MRNTPNLGLTVWDSNNDQFSNEDLANNWDILDEDAENPRPTDRAEILSSLPVSDNFAGRLVYLSAADGGYPAHSLMRFNGSSWRVVGPHEILSAVPGSGNFAGRIVLLSASNGGFAAWTLIVYNGSSWSELGRQITVSATVPVTNNFNGRVVVLSAADGGFEAWDMIVYDGSIYRKVGPAALPPITTSVTGIGALEEGLIAMIQSGDSAYNFDQVTYSGDLANVVTEERVIITQTGVPFTGASATYAAVTTLPQPLIDWETRDDAELVPQVRMIVSVGSSNASGTGYVALVVRAADEGDNQGSFGSTFGELSTSGNANHIKDTGWIPIASTSVANYLNVGVMYKTNNVLYTTSIELCTVYLRWVGAE